ncbi:MAG: transcription-repair coupling factor, partial [Ardenticatenales bacterium]|nr:transcription-repair coupling factor [Ardenticatenales bacterium]
MADPTLYGLVPLLESAPAFQQLREQLQQGTVMRGETPLALQLPGAARPFVTAALAAQITQPLLIVTARPEVALQFLDQMRLFMSEPTRLWNYPDPGALPYERAPWSRDRVQRRIAVLTELASGNGAPVVITNARALLYPTIPRELFTRHVRSYAAGQTVSLKFLLASWYAMGYMSVNIVTEPGQFAHRGGILDIFPTNMVYPIRMELWGDEIDSIRTFDPATQRSIETLKQIIIPPASEALLHRNQESATARLRALNCAACVGLVQQELTEEIRQIEAGERFEGIEFFLPYLYERPGSLFDYIPADTLVLIDDWSALELNVEQVETEALHLRSEKVERGELPTDYEIALHTWDDLGEQFAEHPPLVLGYGASESYGLGEMFQAGPRYGGRLHDAIRVLRENQRQTTQVLLSRQAERLAEMLRNEGVEAGVLRDVTEPPPAGSLSVVNGALNEGFVLLPSGTEPPLHLITDAELFGWSRAVSRRPLRPRKRTSGDFFAEIKEGDFIVHIEHGIGLYQGLVQREVAGITREYLELEYAQGDKLYVPVHQADRVARYLGPTDREPSIHRLGTADWDTARRRAKKAVEEIADELLELYAARALVKGHAFSEDTPWQAEMEASFPYAETEDQLRAIRDVKQDMEGQMPMDRLVIGDVGFGKTEVALRAAFKAVQDDKQVAILVPT